MVTCPGQVRRWVDSIVADWNFNRVIPCHFAAPMRTSPAEFKRAFAFVYEDEEQAQAQAEAAPEPAAGGPAGFLAALVGKFRGKGAQQPKVGICEAAAAAVSCSTSYARVCTADRQACAGPSETEARGAPRDLGCTTWGAPRGPEATSSTLDPQP